MCVIESWSGVAFDGGMAVGKEKEKIALKTE